VLYCSTVAGVERKGKQLCMILDCVKPIEVDGEKHKRVYLFIHMGMTGRISTPGDVPALESLEASDEYPPPHTYLNWSVVDSKKNVIAEASFSDPRKFGSVELAVDQSALDELATDGLTLEEDGKVEEVVAGLTGQSKPIKAILLDQKKVVSGVGNWVADEIMYQCEMHPEQKYLKREEAELVVSKLISILKTSVDHLKRKEDFPQDWMFGYRWTKKRKEAKDSKGRAITFVKSGGRTSAIVPSIQKLQGRENSAGSKAGAKAVKKGEDKNEPMPKKRASRRQPAKKKESPEVEDDKDAADEEGQKSRPKKGNRLKKDASSSKDDEQSSEEVPTKNKSDRRKSSRKQKQEKDEAEEAPASKKKRIEEKQSSSDVDDAGEAEEGVKPKTAANRRKKAVNKVPKKRKTSEGSDRPRRGTRSRTGSS
jgi:formamidopyrimidine-DNA glycosylase